MKTFVKTLVLFTTLITFFAFADKRPNPAKHTFVLVHGAWHGSWTWFKVERILKERGYKVYNINLPGHGVDTTSRKSVTMRDYRDAVISVLDSIPERVILVGHSMGGSVISEVAEHRPNRIKKLVYLAAFLLQDGQSVLDVALSDECSEVPNSIKPIPEKGIIEIVTDVDSIASIFYNCSKPNDIQLGSLLLTPNPLLPVATPISITEENYGSVPRFYIQTLLDNSISPYVQDEMIDALPCEKVFYIDTDHSPFFSRPRMTVDKLIRIANYRVCGKKAEQVSPWKQDIVNSSVSMYSFEKQIHVKNVPDTWSHVRVDFYSLTGRHLWNKQVSANNNITFNVENIGERFVIMKLRSNTGDELTERLLLL